MTHIENIEISMDQLVRPKYGVKCKMYFPLCLAVLLLSSKVVNGFYCSLLIKSYVVLYFYFLIMFNFVS